MITITGDKVAMCDVDDTLIFWDSTIEDRQRHGIEFFYPDEELGSEILVPNNSQIEQLKKLKLRGHTIVVWSAGGVGWAEKAVKTLGLEYIVDVVMCKPSYVFDDLPCEEFMPKSRLIK